MTGADRHIQARRDALAWYIRLDTTRISYARLRAFFEWSKDPVNRASYDKLSEDIRTRASKIV